MDEVDVEELETIMENSKISWTEHTFNPWIGCRHVTPECDHCYADRMVTVRMARDFSKVQRSKTWASPLKWNREADRLAQKLGRRPRVFCASLTDFFLQGADPWRTEAWELIRKCTNLDWLILTKRTKLAASRLPSDWGTGWPHVWLGTTCGCRASEYRLDELRALPAAVRFVSAEPLLESMTHMNLTGINWLIVGGESGPKFRTMEDVWATGLRDKCKAENVGFFFKQHSSFRPGQGAKLEGAEHHEGPLTG
jgi:protein gp37